MEDIKVGEYVRIKDGYIGQLIRIIDDYYLNPLVIDTKIKVRHDGLPETLLYLRKENILKHSPNLIDLIEVGDYVNGYKVKDVWQKINVGAAIDLENNFLGLINDEDIENVVTKEQFASVMYEV